MRSSITNCFQFTKTILFLFATISLFLILHSSLVHLQQTILSLQPTSFRQKVSSSAIHHLLTDYTLIPLYLFICLCLCLCLFFSLSLSLKLTQTLTLSFCFFTSTHSCPLVFYSIRHQMTVILFAFTFSKNSHILYNQIISK